MIKGKFSSAMIGALFIGTVGMTGVMAAVGVDQTPLQAFRAIFSVEKSDAAAPQENAPEVKTVQDQPQPEALGRQFRSYRLRLAEDGLLPGRLSVIDPASGAMIPNPAVRIYFVQNGKTVNSAEPDVGGVFQVANLAPGTYSMVAAGPGGFMALALEVLPFVGNAQADANEVTVELVNFQVEASALGIDGAVVPPNNFNALRAVIRDYVPAAAGATQYIAPNPGAAANDEAFAPGEPAAGMQQHTVLLQPDGTLRGRLRRIHPESGRPVRVRRINVFLMQNDQIVSHSPVDESGSFVVPGLQPGVYSLAAAGQEGFAAFSVQAVIAPATASQGAEENALVRPVALLDEVQGEGGLNNLDIPVIPPEDFAEMMRIFDANVPGGLGGLVPPGMGGPGLGGPAGGPGGFGGGAGGGFGGGGGIGGGLGTLLGAAGLGLGAAALAEADDDDGDGGGGGLGSPFDPFFPEAFLGKDPEVFFEELGQDGLQNLSEDDLGDFIQQQGLGQQDSGQQSPPGLSQP